MKHNNNLFNLFYIFCVISLISINYNCLKAQSSIENCPPLDSFHILPHLPPVIYSNIDYSWVFATVSMLESEYLRQNSDTIKLSEQWFLYYDFIEKTRFAVEKNNRSCISVKSDPLSVYRTINTYGIVPQEYYCKKLNKNDYIKYQKVFKNAYNNYKYLNSNKSSDVKFLTKTKKEAQLTFGIPPDLIYIEGKNQYINPLQFKNDYFRINSYDYFSFMCDTSKTYNQRAVLDLPENWQKSNNYYNLSINDFISAIKESLTNGYTLTLCYKFNKTYFFTHIVGYANCANGWWFYAKNPTYFSKSENGYSFINENFIKNNAISIYMHKYAAYNIVSKIIK